MTGPSRSIVVGRWVVSSLLVVVAVASVGAASQTGVPIRAAHDIAAHALRTAPATRARTPAAVDRAGVHQAGTAPVRPLSGWTPASVSILPSRVADQGVATVVTSSGRQVVVTRGDGDIPSALAREGWVHVGDPGGWGSYLIDAYQAAHTARGKMFLVTMPAGRSAELLHPLAPGEMVNNSFVAVSPDGRWLVSGEWRTVRRFLVFALPRLTPTMSGATVPLATTIDLTRPLRNVQGCSFDGARSLLCSTDDPGVDLFRVSRQIIRIDLAHPLDGAVTTGRPTLVGAVPQVTASCTGHDETEGIDVTDGLLRLTVVEPAACRRASALFVYTRSRL